MHQKLSGFLPVAAFTAAVSLILGSAAVQAQTAPPAAPVAEAAPSPAKPAAAATGSEAQAGGPSEEMEAKFVEAMRGVTFTGRWCLIKDGALGPEKPEKYEIVGAAKSGGDRWVINARIQYGRVNLVVPVPVQMKWAGDTPVIIVDKFSMPGGGTYSARVLVYEGTYAGTWTGGDHGGLLNGLIAKTPEAPAK